jgi:hypothetical protein
MVARTHPHPLMLPLRRFAMGHPYAAEWTILTAVTAAALLLWFSNS